MQRDRLGEGAALHRAVDVRDRTGDAGARHRMQNAEADAVLAEGAQRLALQRIADRAVGRAAQRAVPGKVDLAGLMARVEREVEGVVGGVQAYVAVGRGDGIPVGVAHRDVDAAQHLALAQADVAQVHAVEHGAERPGAHDASLRRRLLTRRRTPAGVDDCTVEHRRLHRRYQPATIGLRRRPMASTPTSTTSPGRRKRGGRRKVPTPAGVPVEMTSPG